MYILYSFYHSQYIQNAIHSYMYTYIPDSLESDVGPAGPIKLFVHRGNTNVLPVRCLQVTQRRVAVDRAGEGGHCLCNLLRVDVKSNGVFEVVSLELARVSFFHMKQS